MAVTSTTLAVALNATDDVCTVTSATGATVGGFIKIDDEVAIIKSISSTKIGLKRRGAYGGNIAKAHDILAGVTFFVASEWPTPQAGERPLAIHPNRDVVYVGQDGAIPLPYKDTFVLITKATAAAITLADPVGVPAGTMVIIGAQVGAAHTVTLTTGYAGSNATDIFTFDTTKGFCLTLIAGAGVWLHVSTGLIAADTVGVAVA